MALRERVQNQLKLDSILLEHFRLHLVFLLDETLILVDATESLKVLSDLGCLDFLVADVDNSDSFNCQAVLALTFTVPKTVVVHRQDPPILDGGFLTVLLQRMRWVAGAVQVRETLVLVISGLNLED